MSLSLPVCKLCKAEIAWKDPVPIVGEDQKQRELAAGFLALVGHIAQKHVNMRPHSQMWFAMFSEFYFLSMFTDLPPILQTAADLKRVQLLRAAGHDDAEVGNTLEASGFKLATGFLDESTLATLVKA